MCVLRCLGGGREGGGLEGKVKDGPLGCDVRNCPFINHLLITGGSNIDVSPACRNLMVWLGK